MEDRPNDEIVLRGMTFHAYHGVMPEEAVTGNRFIVHVRIGLDLRAAGLSDDVNQTVNYASVYEVVRMVVEGPRKNLIEAVAESIAAELLRKFLSIEALVVEVEKPNAPISGIFETVLVRISRSRRIANARANSDS